MSEDCVDSTIRYWVDIVWQAVFAETVRPCVVTASGDMTLKLWDIRGSSSAGYMPSWLYVNGQSD